MNILREYVEEAYTSLLPYFSHQTKFLHVHPDIYKGKIVHVIPVYENFLFALLLLRRKKVESVHQARDMLERLLAFEKKGNFPFFLAEYPVCRDKHLPARLHLLFTTMLKSFSHLLDGVADRLEACLERLDVSAPSVFTMLLEGDFDAFIASKKWMNPSIFGLGFVAFPEQLFDFASSMWNGSSYQGPAWGVFRLGRERETTLFECCMSVFLAQNREIPSWSYKTALELAMITPPDKSFKAADVSLDSSDWKIEQWDNKVAAAALFEPVPAQQAGFYPLVVGELAFRFPNGNICEFRTNCVTIQKKSSERRLVEVFISRSVVQKVEETFFDPVQGITIGEVTLRLVSQECDAIGHLRLGNRPGQLLQTGELFDWVISIDILRSPLSEFQLEVR